MNPTVLSRRKAPALVWCCLWALTLAVAATPAGAQRLTLSELQAQIDALEARAAALEQQGSDQAQALADLQAQIDVLTVELVALEQQGADQGDAIADLEAVLFPPPCGGKCVFVTSTTHDGGFGDPFLGGLAGGDQICNDLATAAGLPGTYRAWLSTVGLVGLQGITTPNDRFIKTISPYRLLNGSTVADNYADLTDGSLQTNIDVDETGATIGAPFQVWTGTLPDGSTFIFNPAEPGNSTCDDWRFTTDPSSGTSVTGIAGDARESTSEWTTASAGLQDCDNSFRLYCFQQ